jgi:DNA uptake protein ComE-like DNA-binding protein
MREFLRQFLLYSRSERRAVVTLSVLIVAVIFIPKAYHFYSSKPVISFSDSSLVKDIAVLQEADTMPEMSGDLDSAKLFQFDPNVIGISDWVLLGLTEKQAAVIEKYKSKGGKFHKPDDLRRIYVLSDEMKDRLVPYVRIERGNSKKDDKDFYTIEINTADSAAYEALEGIGPAYAAHIIKYRKVLGGFYRIEQVGEAYGISDSTFQLIRPHLKVNPSLVSKININETDYEALRKHPYIRAKIAHAIIGYRNMNGKYESLDELKKLKPVTDEIYKKIEPYLTVK